MSRFELDYNPVSKWYIDRENVLPAQIREKLDLMDYIPTKTYQLQVVKKSRVKPQVGDVFVVEPVAGKYFYGRVLATDIDYFTDNEPFSVVIIFNIRTESLNLDNFIPDYNRILHNPCFIHDMYWQRGFFYTVGNIPLNDEEKNLDYGFFKWFTLKPGGYFVDCYGNELSQQPTIVSSSGAETIYGVAMGLWQEFIINPSLLDDEYDFSEEGVIRKADVCHSEISDTEESSIEGAGLMSCKFLSYFNNGSDSGVCLSVEDDSVFALGERVNEIEDMAYMNGYNWEVLIRFYLAKEYPVLLEGLECDSEAGLFVGYYSDGVSGKEKADKLYGVLEAFVGDEQVVCGFVERYGKEIEWE